MNEPREIRPGCEHRFTKMETILSNHVPHVDSRLKELNRKLWIVLGAIAVEVLGLLFYLIRGQIVIR